MIEKILGFADEIGMFPENCALLACVSGGADSVCLLEALLEISAMRGYTVSAAHFNHMLRGAESDRDEAFVRDYCTSRGVSLIVGRGDVADHASVAGLSVEEAARKMRYNFFYSAAEEIGARRIVTAHTADDNAETILMNLIRGAGANGLSGIPPMRSASLVGAQGAPIRSAGPVGAQGALNREPISVVRPMLPVTRSEVLMFLEERGIPFIEDSSNNLDVYTRNKIRHSIVPLITEINPKFTTSAAAAAELLRADNDYLSALADDYTGQNAADTSVLSGLPFAISSRVIRKLSGVSLSHKHVKTVLDMCGRGGAPSSLSLPGVTAYFDYGKLTFEANADREHRDGAGAAGTCAAGTGAAGSGAGGSGAAGTGAAGSGAAGSGAAGSGAVRGLREGFTPVLPVPGESVSIGTLNLIITCESVICNEPDELYTEADDRINKSFTSFLFKNDALCGRITVRSRREGDNIRFPGRTGSKTLKKLFIERRIPARERAFVPVIADEAGVLAIYGIGTGDRAAPLPGEKAVRLIFERNSERNTR